MGSIDTRMSVLGIPPGGTGVRTMLRREGRCPGGRLMACSADVRGGPRAPVGPHSTSYEGLMWPLGRDVLRLLGHMAWPGVCGGLSPISY